MKVVYFLHTLNADELIKALRNINIPGGGLHQHVHAVPKYWDGCKEAEQGENEGANGICEGPLSVVDNNGSDHHANALHDITNQMDDGSSDVHIFMAMTTMSFVIMIFVPVALMAMMIVG